MSQGAAEVLKVDLSSKPKKKWVMITLVILITVLCSAAGAYFLFFKKNELTEPSEPVKKVTPKTLVYLPLETFVVNLLSDADGDQMFLQIGINLQVEDNQEVSTIKMHMPQVRSRMLLLLSMQSAKVLETPAGKSQLIAEILTEIKRPFAAELQEQKVSNVFFTSFIIQ